MELALKNTIKKKRIALAVSGGADSMAMLSLFLESDYDFFVLNIEHGIRGERSVGDSKFVRDFCDSKGVACYCVAVKAADYAKEKGISIETSARLLRHDVFKTATEGNLSGVPKCDFVATAHHADDNAESILMHILRGSGLGGLIGMNAVDAHIIRPLIASSKSEINAYIDSNKIPFVEDSSNGDIDYTRNFLRLEIMPKIQEVYPSAKNSLNNLSKSATEVNDFVSKFISDKIVTANGKVLLPRDEFSSAAYLNYLNTKKCLDLLGVSADIERVHYAAVGGLMALGSGKQLDLPHFVTVKRTRAGLMFFVQRDKIRRKK